MANAIQVAPAVSQSLTREQADQQLEQLLAKGADSPEVRAECERALAQLTPDERLDFVWGGSLRLADLRRVSDAEWLLERYLERSDANSDFAPILLVSLAGYARERQDAQVAMQRLERAELAAQRSRVRSAKAEVALERAQVAIVLGLPDLAAAQLQGLRASQRFEDEPGLWVRTELVFANWMFNVESYAALDSVLTEQLVARASQTDASGETSGAASQVRLLRAARDSELARGSSADLAELQARFRELLGTPYATSAGLALVDLALRRSEPAAAREQLAALDVSRATPEELMRSASLGVAVALAENASRAELERTARALSDRLEQFLAHVRAQAPRAGGWGFLRYGTARAAFSEWTRVQLALDSNGQGVVRALEPLLRAQELGTVARALGAKADLERVRRELVREDCGVVVLLPALDRSHVFAIGPQGLTHAETASQSVLWERATALASAWSAQPSTDEVLSHARSQALAEQGRAAAEVFLPDAIRAAVRGWSSWSICGAEACLSPAFECFVLEGGEFLGLQVGLTYVPSLPLAVALAERERARRREFTHELALIAVPSNEPLTSALGLAELSIEPERLELLCAPFRSVVRGVGSAATRAALARSDTARMLTVLAHGAHDGAQSGDLERPALLVLAPQEGERGAVGCAELERGPLPALVQLLACGVARGPLRVGDDTSTSLVGACLAGGAATVLAPRIDVGVDSAVELAAEMNRALAGGDPPARALLTARRALAQRSERADPWHWASLALYGSPGEPLFGARPPNWWSNKRALFVIVLAGLALVAAALWARRRRTDQL